MTLPRVASHTGSNNLASCQDPPSHRGARVPLILASASPRRRDLLAQIGIEPDRICPANIDETPRQLSGGRKELPRPYAERMAREKARALCQPGSTEARIILAADTVVCVGTRILPKVEDEKTAGDCLSLLSGRSHRVYSGVCVICPDGRETIRVVETRVKIRHLDDSAVEAYLASQEWCGKAGGYAIQGRFARHVISIIGSYSNVVGLPLYETANLLTGAGWKPR